MPGSLRLALALGIAASACGGYTNDHGRREQPGADARERARVDHSGAEIIEACSANFMPAQRTGHAFILRLSGGELVLAAYAALDSPTLERFDVLTGSAPQDTSKLELQCLDGGQVRERNTAITEAGTVEGAIRSPEGVGVICLAAEDPCFVCYAFDPARRNFVDAGGWCT